MIKVEEEHQGLRETSEGRDQDPETLKGRGSEARANIIEK